MLFDGSGIRIFLGVWRGRVEDSFQVLGCQDAEQLVGLIGFLLVFGALLRTTGLNASPKL